MASVRGVETSTLRLSGEASGRAGALSRQARPASAIAPTMSGGRTTLPASRAPSVGSSSRVGGGARGGREPGGDAPLLGKGEADAIRGGDHALDDDRNAGAAAQLIQVQHGGVAHPQA